MGKRVLGGLAPTLTGVLLSLPFSPPGAAGVPELHLLREQSGEEKSQKEAATCGRTHSNFVGVAVRP